MNKLFSSARLKLTGWYLLLIMLISFIFSSVIYDGINSELQQFERLQQVAQEREQLGLPPLRIPRSIPVELLNPEVIQEARTRLITRLLTINLGILVLSGIAGYFLAGQTLRPIKEMVDEQNRFITDASHELRTPLTALRSEMEVELLNKKMTVAEAKAIIESNLEEVINLQSLTDNLLELAQNESLKSVIELSPVFVNEVIEESVKKVTPMAKKKKIVIQNEMQKLSVKGNTEQLRELFVILLDNAIKYSPQKTTVTISSRTSVRSAYITVADRGIGIDSKDIPFIFDRFYRADSSRTKSTASGYGLGLSIAQKIIDQHHGLITVKSKVKEGTSITIKLPLAR